MRNHYLRVTFSNMWSKGAGMHMTSPYLPPDFEACAEQMEVKQWGSWILFYQVSSCSPSHAEGPLETQPATTWYVMTLANHLVSKNIQDLQFLTLSHLICKREDDMTPTCQARHEDWVRMYKTSTCSGVCTLLQNPGHWPKSPAGRHLLSIRTTL